jgi:hypothetical protein
MLAENGQFSFLLSNSSIDRFLGGRFLEGRSLLLGFGILLLARGT